MAVIDFPSDLLRREADQSGDAPSQFDGDLRLSLVLESANIVTDWIASLKRRWQIARGFDPATYCDVVYRRGFGEHRITFYAPGKSRDHAIEGESFADVLRAAEEYATRDEIALCNAVLGIG